MTNHDKIETDAQATRLGPVVVAPHADMSEALATRLVNPDDGKPHDLEHSGAKIVRLATELLAELTHLREYGLMAADDVATATAGVRALLDSGAADEIDVEQIISGLVVWCDNLLSKWEGEWHRTGRDECAEGGQNPPMYFRGA